jgi:hypothetical protein
LFIDAFLNSKYGGSSETTVEEKIRWIREIANRKCRDCAKKNKLSGNNDAENEE